MDGSNAWGAITVPGMWNFDDRSAVYNAIAVDKLAVLWCSLQRLGLKDQTEQSWAATLYFDRLPHDSPDRALDLALAVLASDAERRVKMQLGDKFMSTLIYNHAGRVIDRIEAEQATNPRLRWVLGAVHWWAPTRELKVRLARVADEAAWRADELARDTPVVRIDFGGLSKSELARVWVDQHGKADMDRDANWHALMDFERGLIERNPDAAIDLVLEVLRIETGPQLLSVLAAGLVEDVISRDTIDRIEREAAANERFRDLLGWVWCFDHGAELRTRIEAAARGRHW
jgi:hypothetical protein